MSSSPGSSSPFPSPYNGRALSPPKSSRDRSLSRPSSRSSIRSTQAPSPSYAFDDPGEHTTYPSFLCFNLASGKPVFDGLTCHGRSFCPKPHVDAETHHQTPAGPTTHPREHHPSRSSPITRTSRRQYDFNNVTITPTNVICPRRSYVDENEKTLQLRRPAGHRRSRIESTSSPTRWRRNRRRRDSRGHSHEFWSGASKPNGIQTGL